MRRGSLLWWYLFHCLFFKKNKRLYFLSVLLGVYYAPRIKMSYCSQYSQINALCSLHLSSFYALRSGQISRQSSPPQPSSGCPGNQPLYSIRAPFDCNLQLPSCLSSVPPIQVRWPCAEMTKLCCGHQLGEFRNRSENGIKIENENRYRWWITIFSFRFNAISNNSAGWWPQHKGYNMRNWSCVVVIHWRWCHMCSTKSFKSWNCFFSPTNSYYWFICSK